MTNLAEKIETLLEKNIYTNKEIAIKLAVSLSKVDRIEKGIINEERANHKNK
tara:strand:+ start:400 stop:555 length:156 start_codon:yes stop_codon:yes gene_type:complete